MTKTLEETARELAGAHRAEDEDIREVWMYPDRDEKEVRLLEVSDSVEDAGILPFRFGTHPPDVLYPSVVILVSRSEKKRIDDNNLSLPASWTGVAPVELKP